MKYCPYENAEAETCKITGEDTSCYMICSGAEWECCCNYLDLCAKARREVAIELKLNGVTA